MKIPELIVDKSKDDIEMDKIIRLELPTSRKCKFVESSGNIFRDLGFANPELEMKIFQEKYKLFVKQKKDNSIGVSTNPSGKEK